MHRLLLHTFTAHLAWGPSVNNVTHNSPNFNVAVKACYCCCVTIMYSSSTSATLRGKTPELKQQMWKHKRFSISFILPFYICPTSLCLCFLPISLCVNCDLTSPALKRPSCSFKCCLEMFPGAFTRGNSVAFSLLEACWYYSWPCPRCSLTTSIHIQHTPFSLNPLFGRHVTCFHLYVTLNTW